MSVIISNNNFQLSAILTITNENVSHKQFETKKKMGSKPGLLQKMWWCLVLYGQLSWDPTVALLHYYSSSSSHSVMSDSIGQEYEVIL